jgi:hypothetical protein
MTAQMNGGADEASQPARAAEASGPAMPLGIEGFCYADLYRPGRLQELLEVFDQWFAAEAPACHERFSRYRASRGEGLSPIERSDALVAAAPFVGRFVGRLFGIEPELAAFREAVRADDPLWRFRKDFAKKSEPPRFPRPLCKR